MSDISPLERLPCELLHEIVQYLPQQSARNLAIVGKRIFTRVEPCTYATIDPIKDNLLVPRGGSDDWSKFKWIRVLVSSVNSWTVNSWAMDDHQMCAAFENACEHMTGVHTLQIIKSPVKKAKVDIELHRKIIPKLPSLRFIDFVPKDEDTSELLAISDAAKPGTIRTIRACLTNNNERVPGRIMDTELLQFNAENMLDLSTLDKLDSLTIRNDGFGCVNIMLPKNIRSYELESSSLNDGNFQEINKLVRLRHLTIRGGYSRQPIFHSTSMIHFHGLTKLIVEAHCGFDAVIIANPLLRDIACCNISDAALYAISAAGICSSLVITCNHPNYMKYSADGLKSLATCRNMETLAYTATKETVCPELLRLLADKCPRLSKITLCHDVIPSSMEWPYASGDPLSGAGTPPEFPEWMGMLEEENGSDPDYWNKFRLALWVDVDKFRATWDRPCDLWEQAGYDGRIFTTAYIDRVIACRKRAYPKMIGLEVPK